jgi:hypothetical protein
MRRDVYIENDSGGLSVLAHDAVSDIIEDQRSDDMKFVTGFKALLLELYGDDSMPVRIVVDEPLRKDEEAQWLARASWRIDASDGRLLVMGGFDPDVLSWWKDETGGDRDGRGVAVVDVPEGALRIDVYAHVGSNSGRQILSEGKVKPGRAFRQNHPDRPFPLWLANMLDFSGEDDPGHEDLWRDMRASIGSGALAVDVSGRAAIGFVVHVQRSTQAPGAGPESGWFAYDENARVPATFPLGLESEVPDANIELLRNKLLGRDDETPVPQPVSKTTEVIAAWTGDPPASITGHEATLAIEPADAFLLYWMAALTADSSPRFELWITPKGAWSAPASTPDYGVVSFGDTTALRPSSDMGGWGLWRGAREASAVLATVPEGSSIELAMAPHERFGEEVDPQIGRARYRGEILGGRLQLTEASPAIDRATLADALAFVRDVVTNEQIPVRSQEERRAFDNNAAMYCPEEDRLIWEGELVRLFASDDRMLILLAQPVFRTRFGAQWKCDADEEDED